MLLIQESRTGHLRAQRNRAPMQNLRPPIGRAVWNPRRSIQGSGVGYCLRVCYLCVRHKLDIELEAKPGTLFKKRPPCHELLGASPLPPPLFLFVAGNSTSVKMVRRKSDNTREGMLVGGLTEQTVGRVTRTDLSPLA